MPTMSAFLSPDEPVGQDISPASHVPLPWRSGEPRTDTGAKSSHVAADAAFCCVQSTLTWLLTHSHDTSPSSVAAVSGRHCPLIHTIPASQQRSAVCRVHSNSHDSSPTSAAAVGRGHPLIHMILAPHQWLPCVEDTLIHMIPAPHKRQPWVKDTLSFTWYQRLPCVEDNLSFTWYQPHISVSHG